MKATKTQILAAMKGSGGIYLQILANLKHIKYKKQLEPYLKKLTKPADIAETTRVFLSTQPEVMTRQSLKERIDNDADLQEALKQEADLIDDLGESAFAQALQRREPWAVRQWLKYRGKRREYVPAMKIDHTSDDKPLPPAMVYFPEQLPYDIVNTKGAINAQQTTQPETEEATE